MSDLTMQEIDAECAEVSSALERASNPATYVIHASGGFYLRLLAAARRGVEASAQPVAQPVRNILMVEVDGRMIPTDPTISQPVSDERIREIGKDAFGIDMAFDGHLMKFARALLREAQPEAWQPIETAPKDGTKIPIWPVQDCARARHTDRGEEA